MRLVESNEQARAFLEHPDLAKRLDAALMSGEVPKVLGVVPAESGPVNALALESPTSGGWMLLVRAGSRTVAAPAEHIAAGHNWLKSRDRGLLTAWSRALIEAAIQDTSLAVLPGWTQTGAILPVRSTLGVQMTAWDRDGVAVTIPVSNELSRLFRSQPELHSEMQQEVLAQGTPGSGRRFLAAGTTGYAVLIEPPTGQVVGEVLLLQPGAKAIRLELTSGSLTAGLVAARARIKRGDQTAVLLDPRLGLEDLIESSDGMLSAKICQELMNGLLREAAEEPRGYVPLKTLFHSPQASPESR